MSGLFDSCAYILSDARNLITFPEMKDKRQRESYIPNPACGRKAINITALETSVKCSYVRSEQEMWTADLGRDGGTF